MRREPAPKPCGQWAYSVAEPPQILPSDSRPYTLPMNGQSGTAPPVPPAEPRTWLLAVSLAIAAMAVMAASIDGPFLFDDVALIQGNHNVHGFEHWTEWFTKTLWDTNYDPSADRESRGFWRPIILVSYAFDWWVGGGSPLAFHVTNLLVHALNAVLLFVVLTGWVPGRLAAFFGALLFAVHPVQTEPVAWIAGRTDSLCALGLLVALLGLRRSRYRRWSGLALLALGLVIALGAKEAAVVFPVLAAIEVWAWQPGPLDAGAARRVLGRIWPFIALSLLYFAVHRLLVTASSPLPRLNAFNAVPLALEAWGRYAALLLWPDDLTLGRAMVRVEQDVLLAHPGYVALGAALLLLVLGAAWRLRRAQPAAALGALAFGATLLPVSGIVWLGYFISVSPRFLYIPLLGLALALAALLAAKVDLRLRVACLALMTLLGARAFVRGGDFGSEEAFWRREITANERYPAAQQFLISRELNAGRPRSALRLAHRWFQLFEAGDGSEIGTASLIRSTVAAVLALTPDVDRESLRAVQAFTGTLARARPSELELPRLGLHLRVAANSWLLNRIANDRRHFLIMSGEAASRIGDDEAAVEAVEAALDGCDDCWTVLVTSALILARAGELDRATLLAERAVRYGPPGAKLDYTLASVRQAAEWRSRPTTGDSNLRQVGFHSTLGSFGRAYAVARPAIERLSNDPASLHAVGELAFRAGDVSTSRSLLGRMLPPPVVEQRLAELSSTVRWFEQPSAPGEWVPD